MKQKTIIIVLCFITVFLTGCGKIKLFPEKKDPYALTETKKEKLKENNYYVKDGTKFYSVFMPEASFSGITTKVTDDRVFWVGKDIALIPTLYKNESIAFSSQIDNLEAVILERFEYLGYSIGAYFIEYDNEKNLMDLYTDSNAVKGTSMYNVLTKAKSKNIKIETVNGKTVTADMLNNNGIFTCFEKNANYELGYYAGTYYTESTVKADTQYFSSYEIFLTDQISYTKNGYLSITMPDYLKSGYYYINGCGIFRYINEDKGSVDIASVDYNVPTTAEDIYGEDVSKYQSYSMTLDETKENMYFRIILDDSENEDIEAVLTSPAGVEYYFSKENDNLYTCYLGVIQAGKWTVRINTPEDKVKEASLISIPSTLKTYMTEYVAQLEEGESVTFELDYEIKDRNGTYNKMLVVLVSPDGTVNNFVHNYNNYNYTSKVPYTQSGIYTIKAYYYTDYVDIKDVIYLTDDGKKKQLVY